jgi:hypothetical protein
MRLRGLELWIPSLSGKGIHGSKHDPTGIGGRERERGWTDGCSCCCHFCCQRLLRRKGSLTAPSTTLPARCTIKPLDAGSGQFPFGTTLLRTQSASSIATKNWPAPRPPVLPAWPGTSRPSGAWSNAYGRAARNRAATRRATTAPATILAAELAHALTRTRTRAF